MPIAAHLNGARDIGDQLGFNVFKIAKTAFVTPLVTGTVAFDSPDNDLLTQYCAIERWTGDLSNGLFQLGERAARMHRLEQRSCGLLNLVRCYTPQDRNHVLELFEQAATVSSSFCFSTTIEIDGIRRQPVLCVGESTGLEHRYAGAIIGVFIFPRFQVENGHGISPAQ
ncbi:hypothetical protein [Mycoplana rhizolycopersici]|uniref:hypothetical protein n=1 Tax=Mycoplana rhizolycopersici TaxID=2746702 RepID=UPI001AEE04B2|nr:hypothetical protein [Rhizobium rhizolycopersici]